MRHRISESTPGKVVFFLVVLTIALATWLGALAVRLGALAAQIGSLGLTGAQPSPDPADSSTTDPDVESISEEVLPPVGNSEFHNLLYLSKVTFAPYFPAPDSHRHRGQFVLTVNSGAVCYELGPMDASTTVTAVIPSSAPVNAECSGMQSPDCVIDETTGTRTCTLRTGDIVYLPAGSSLTQNGDADHRYGNIDGEPAVVYLAGHQEDRPEVLGCAGGCW